MVKVLFDQIEEAFQLSNQDISYWLDRNSGKLILVSAEFLDQPDYFEDDDERQAAHEILILRGDIENKENLSIDSDRYVGICPPDSDEKWKWMEEFSLFQVSDALLQEKLAGALHGRKPFRSFKDILIYQPEIEKKWFEFEAEKFREYAVELVKLEQFEIDFTVPEKRVS